MKYVIRQNPSTKAGIVHLGLGAFSRAHIAIYTEDAIKNEAGDWGKDIDTVKNFTGISDAAPVVHEPFTQWVIEDDFVNNERPNWEAAGAELVSDVRPYELMKLRMLNGTHSALAYLGFLAGFETISDTVADVDFRKFTELLWREEIAPSVIAPSGLSLSTYAADLMTRYSNPSIRHLTRQIAMDGSQKLPQRILGIIDESFSEESKLPGLILTIAAWMRYVRGNDEAGEKIDVRDPLSQRFAAMAESATESSDWVASILAMREVFPEQLAKILAEPATHAYLELEKHGAHYSVRKVIRLHGCHA